MSAIYIAPPTPPITTTTQEIGYLYAAGFIQGNGANSFVNGATVVRNGVGQYTVTFDTPHPNGANYAVNLTSHEDGAARDSPYIHVVDGTQTAAGFDVYIATGDNGGTADVLNDTPWSFHVHHLVTVVTGVV